MPGVSPSVSQAVFRCRYRAVEQPHALIFEMNLELAIGPDGDDAEIDVLRLDVEFRFAERFAGQLVEELIEAAIMVGEFGRFLRGQRKVDAAQTAEKGFEITLFQQVTGGVPFLDAGQGQLVEIAAGRPVGKTNGLANIARRPRRDRRFVNGRPGRSHRSSSKRRRPDWHESICCTSEP